MSCPPEWDIRSASNDVEVQTMLRTREERAPYRRTKGPMPWILIVMAGLLACPLPSVEAIEMDNATMDAIEFVAQQHRANKEKIVTWKGDVVVRSTVTTGQDRQEVTASVAYAVDTAKQQARWNWTTTDARFVTGNTVTELPRFTNNGLITDGVFYRMKGSGQETEPYNRIAIHDPAVEPRHFGNDDFEPTYFLTDFGEDMCERLLAIRGWAASPQTPGASAIDAKLDGSVLTVELSRPGTNGFNRYKFDLNQGGNMISYASRDSVVETENTYQYIQAGDTWVLGGMQRKSIRKSPEGAVLRETSRTVEWTSNSVNVPLADAEFSLEAIGARPGDLVYDQIIGMRYRFKTEGLADSVRELESSRMAQNEQAAPARKAPNLADHPEKAPSTPSSASLRPTWYHATLGLIAMQQERLFVLTLGFMIAGSAAATIHYLRRADR